MFTILLKKPNKVIAIPAKQDLMHVVTPVIAVSYDVIYLDHPIQGLALCLITGVAGEVDGSLYFADPPGCQPAKIHPAGTETGFEAACLATLLQMDLRP